MWVFQFSFMWLRVFLIDMQLDMTFACIAIFARDASHRRGLLEVGVVRCWMQCHSVCWRHSLAIAICHSAFMVHVLCVVVRRVLLLFVSCISGFDHCFQGISVRDDVARFGCAHSRGRVRI